MQKLMQNRGSKCLSVDPYVLTEVHAVLHISFILFYERVYHSCLAPLRLIMVTASHCEHAVLMVRRGMSTPCLHTTPTTTTVFPTQTIQREEGMWAQLGIVPQTHQSCLTSPAVPALLLIILSTVNDSYSAPIIPLNVTLFDYSSFSHHWTTVIPATVIPTTGPLTFLFIGRLSFQAIGPVSFLYIEPLLFKSVVSLPFKHAKPLPFLPTGLSFLHWTNHLNLLYDSNSCLFVNCHS